MFNKHDVCKQTNICRNIRTLNHNCTMYLYHMCFFGALHSENAFGLERAQIFILCKHCNFVHVNINHHVVGHLFQQENFVGATKLKANVLLLVICFSYTMELLFGSFRFKCGELKLNLDKFLILICVGQKVYPNECSLMCSITFFFGFSLKLSAIELRSLSRNFWFS